MTCRQYILEVFDYFPYGAWVAGGVIEDRVRAIARTKASGVARILRSMTEEDEFGVPLKDNPLEKTKVKGYVEYKKVII